MVSMSSTLPEASDIVGQALRGVSVLPWRWLASNVIFAMPNRKSRKGYALPMTVDKALPGVTGAEERWLRVWGQRVRLLIRPATVHPARPVVFLNGIGVRADVLNALIDEFDPSLEVVRLDPPGIGGTPSWPIPYGIPHMAAWTLAVLNKLGHDQVDVIGYSWGGVVAQQMALQCARRVRRLVLLSTNTGSISVPGSMLSTAMMFSPLVAQMLHTDDRTIGRLYGGCARRRADDVRTLLASDFDEAGVGLFHQLVAAMTWTTMTTAWFIHQPTLILAGTDDPMVPFANARILKRNISASLLRPFDGGHLDPVLEPRWFATEISRFLTTERPGLRS